MYLCLKTNKKNRNILHQNLVISNQYWHSCLTLLTPCMTALYQLHCPGGCYKFPLSVCVLQILPGHAGREWGGSGEVSVVLVMNLALCKKRLISLFSLSFSLQQETFISNAMTHRSLLIFFVWSSDSPDEEQMLNSTQQHKGDASYN